MVVDIPDRCIVIALRSCWHRLKGASPEGAWRAQGLVPPVARWQPLYWRDDAIGSPLSQLAVFAPDISPRRCVCVVSCPLYLRWYLYCLRTTKPWRLHCCFSLCSLFLVLSFGTPPLPPLYLTLSSISFFAHILRPWSFRGFRIWIPVVIAVSFAQIKTHHTGVSFCSNNESFKIKKNDLKIGKL